MKKYVFLLVALLMTVSGMSYARQATPAKKATPAVQAPPAASAAPVKKDGTPDRRYKANKKLKKDGTPDKRYKQHKTAAPAAK